MNKKFYIFVTGALFSGLIQGLALATFGPFQDSANYRELFNTIVDSGFITSLISFIAQTAKFEPMILLLFTGESVFLGSNSTEFVFLLLNMLVLNVLVVAVVFPFMDAKARNSLSMFGIGFAVTLTYLVFSKQLYFWRNVIGFAFFMLFMHNRGARRWLWAVIAVCSHFSIALFIPLYLLVEYIARLNRRAIYLAFFLAMCGVVFLVQLLPDLLGAFASGGDASGILAAGGAHAIKVWLSVLFAFIVLVLVSPEYMKSDALRPLYVFCMATVIACLLSYNSYHFMNRLFLPASMIVGFLPFLFRNRSIRFTIAKLLIVLSILPSLRLVFMLFSGSFAPE